jgi:hypothetical protein
MHRAISDDLRFAAFVTTKYQVAQLFHWSGSRLHARGPRSGVMFFRHANHARVASSANRIPSRICGDRRLYHGGVVSFAGLLLV